MDLVIVSKSDLQDLIQESFQTTLSALHQPPAQSPDSLAKKWLTNAEARAILSLSKTTLQRYRDEGRLSFSKIAGSIYYRRSDIDELLERNIRRPTAEVAV